MGIPPHCAPYTGAQQKAGAAMTSHLLLVTYGVQLSIAHRVAEEAIHITNGTDSASASGPTPSLGPEERGPSGTGAASVTAASRRPPAAALRPQQKKKKSPFPVFAVSSPGSCSDRTQNVSLEHQELLRTKADFPLWPLPGGVSCSGQRRCPHIPAPHWTAPAKDQRS
jgi:hypothetical protein